MAKAFKIRNIERTFLGIIGYSLFILLFFTLYYLATQQEFFLEGDISSMKIFLCLVSLVEVVKVIIKVANTADVEYCITDKRIFILTNVKRQKIKIINKADIWKKKIISSPTDRQYHVHTIKLMTHDDESYIESVDDGTDLMAMT